MILEITSDSPVLRQETAPVLDFGIPFQTLVMDMTETLDATPNGVGLAAPQVGVGLALSVILIKRKWLVLANPRIRRRVGYRQLTEGCLSLPGCGYKVMHARDVYCVAQDENGVSRYIEAHGDLLAQALEHEVDHLHGKMIDDFGRLLSKPMHLKTATENT